MDTNQEKLVKDHATKPVIQRKNKTREHFLNFQMKATPLTSSFILRIDTLMYLLAYPQIPMVRTKVGPSSSPCAYNPGQNVWDTLPFMPNSCNIRSLPPTPRCNVGRLFGKPFHSNNIAWGGGGGGELGFVPKSLCFHVKNDLCRGIAFCKSVPHNFGQDCSLFHFYCLLSFRISCLHFLAKRSTEANWPFSWSPIKFAFGILIFIPICHLILISNGVGSCQSHIEPVTVVVYFKMVPAVIYLVPSSDHWPDPVWQAPSR